MPVSQRTEGEGGEDYNRKRKSKPTNKRRNERQEIKRKYSHSREDAQLLGIIPTTPEGAIKSEVVDPATQEDLPDPVLIKRAIRAGWAVPEDRKIGLVDELVAIVDNPDMPAKVKIAAFNALRMADETQFERDHPELARTMRGGNDNKTTIIGTVNNVQNNIDAAAVIREMVDAGQLGLIEELPASAQSLPPGDGGHQREVDTCPPLEGDEQRISEGVADT